ncbi:MAG: hypothetical protein KGH54_00595 [Candidatus Micrarchaeota archaeon]|nr:hypothetical protein [Candidatus Micrarchaeota archaeon]
MAKKNNRKEEGMHEHMMMHRARRGRGILSLIVGLIFIYIAYTWNPAVIATIIVLGIGVWFVSMACMKLGWSYWGRGCCCGCGCGCGGECNCVMDNKH